MLCLRLGPAVEAAPVQPHPAGKFIASIDGNEEVLDPAVRPADQCRLDILLRRAEQRVLVRSGDPTLQVQDALGHSGRARIEASDPARVP